MNFFDSIRSRAKLNCRAEIGYETAVTVLKVNEAVEKACRLEFKPEEFIIGFKRSFGLNRILLIGAAILLVAAVAPAQETKELLSAYIMCCAEQRLKRNK